MLNLVPTNRLTPCSKSYFWFNYSLVCYWMDLRCLSKTPILNVTIFLVAWFDKFQSEKRKTGGYLNSLSKAKEMQMEIIVCDTMGNSSTCRSSDKIPVFATVPAWVSLHLPAHIHHSLNAADQALSGSQLGATSPSRMVSTHLMK